MQVGPELVRPVRRPGLPARHHPRRLRPRPGQVEGARRRRRRGPERERGDHAEVPAAAALTGPEQVAVLLRAGVDVQHRSVGGDDLHLLQAVAGQTVGPRGHADAAAERQPGDADGRAGPARHRPVLGRQRVVEVDQPGAGADHRGRAGHGHGPEVLHVDDQPAGVAGVAAVAVPAGPGGERDLELAHERDARRHVVRALHVGDAGRALPVEPRVEQQAVGVVGGLARPDQGPGQIAGERGPVGWRRPGRTGGDAGRHGPVQWRGGSGDRGVDDFGDGDGGHRRRPRRR